MESAKTAGRDDADAQVSLFARPHSVIYAGSLFQVDELKELHAKELASGAESREALSNEVQAKFSAYV